MKLLRFIYMILATIILSPLILTVLIISWFTILTIAIKVGGFKVKELLYTTNEYWWYFVKTGIEMNIDFIRNGFTKTITVEESK